MSQTPRHKVFISFHDDDKKYKDMFVRRMGDGIVNKSVDDGDIEITNIRLETIRQNIRDEHIVDSTVVVVLIGPCTWQRKHVDWEISYGLLQNQNKLRCGLLGILLPDHPSWGKKDYDLNLIPPRLADNCDGDSAYAHIYDWTRDTVKISNWIHKAFLRRNEIHPDNARPQFGNNRSGDCARGWQP